MTPTPYQHAVLSIPENINVLLDGGRGGGKSVALGFAFLRHMVKYGGQARGLVVRETYKSLLAVEELFEHLFTTAFDGKFQYNRAEKVFRLPNEATLELGQLDDAHAWKKYQGRGHSMLGVDEYGLLKERRYVAQLKSNLRAGEGIPLRTIATSNPGGPLHTFIHRNHILAAPPWHLYQFEGETWVNAPSTYKDNPHLQDGYREKLRASTTDDAMFLAFADGDWGAATLGSFFGADLDEKVHLLPTAWPFLVTKEWAPFISMDWGSSAPCVVYLCLRAPGDIGPYPKGSLILLDEIHSAHKDDLSQGLKYPPSVIAEMIHEMCARWSVKHIVGIGDDAYGIDDHLLGVLEDFGIHLEKPEKARASGWQSVRQLLKNAKDRNGKPGLWATQRCEYFWATMPFIGRDPNRPEDLDTNGLDHGADAVRYAAMHSTRRGAFGRVVGLT